MSKKLSEKLRPASFRGVKFHVDSAKLEAGRRTTVHEYPQRDKPWVEDLGRGTRAISFDAFVVGANYIEHANQLLNALEKPGPGTLIHPWFGTLNVSLKDMAQVSFNAALGYAQLTLSFIEAGELVFPSASDATQEQTKAAACALELAAMDEFIKRFSINNVLDFVKSAASKALKSVLEAIKPDIPGMKGIDTKQIKCYLKAVEKLISHSQKMAEQVKEVISITQRIKKGMPWPEVIKTLLKFAKDKSLKKPEAPTNATASQKKTCENTTVINDLARRLILAQAVGASSFLPALVNEETLRLRDQLCEALDEEALQATDKVYVALMEARSKLWKDLTERAKDGARLSTITPSAVLPSLALAYDYYEDATRGTDLVMRNGIRHPGFIPPEALKVLTR